MCTPFLIVVTMACSAAISDHRPAGLFLKPLRGLTHYGATPVPIHFGADYVSEQKMAPVGIDRIRIEYSDLGFGGASLVEDSGMEVSCG
jgi:hypothetical protein